LWFLIFAISQTFPSLLNKQKSRKDPRNGIGALLVAQAMTALLYAGVNTLPKNRDDN